MVYRQYGNTGKQVSALGFGAMRFRAEDYGPDNYDKCAALVVRAAELGVNYFDTAPVYCDGHSEGIIGAALRELRRRGMTYYVSTKNSTDMTAPDARDVFWRTLEQSLRRLDVPRIDFYHMWGVLSYEHYRCRADGGFFEEAQKAREQGLLSHITLSTHMQGGDIDRVLDETDDFAGVLMGFNAVNFRFRRAGIASAARKGLGVVIMNPLSGGLIPQNAARYEYLSDMDPAAQDATSAALRFVGRYPGVTVALSGMSTVGEVESNVRAMDDLPVLTGDELAAYETRAAIGADDLCTSCGYCDSCPVGIPVPKFMDTYNQFMLTGNPAAMNQRTRMHWAVDIGMARDCTACGQCESLCTQRLPIIKRMASVAERADSR